MRSSRGPRALLVAAGAALLVVGAAAVWLTSSEEALPASVATASDAETDAAVASRPARAVELAQGPVVASEVDDREPARANVALHELHGRVVVDDEDTPVTAFEVRVEREGRVRVERFEDDSGRFVIGDLEEGTWEALASAEGFATMGADGIDVPVGEPVVLSVARCGVVSVLVVGLDGAPVAGARVRARGDGGEASTDADGLAVLECVRLGGLFVLASAPGLANGVSETVQLTRSRPRAEVRVVLGRGGRVVGQVLDLEGAPTADVRLTLQGGPHHREAVTAADGSFALERVPAARYFLTCLPGGLDRVPRQQVEVEVREGETTVARFDDLRGSQVLLSGLVRRDGEPLAGGLLRVSWNERGESHLERSVGIDRDGRFEVALHDSGEHVVEIVPPGSTFRDEPQIAFFLDVPPQPRHAVELAWDTGGLAGRVWNALGEPASGVRVSLVERTDDRLVEQGTAADGDGRYELRRVPAGSYDLHVQEHGEDSSSGPLRAVDRVEIVAGRTLQYDVHMQALAAVQGSVRGPGGESVAGADVAWISAEGFPQRITTTDSAGAFALEDVDPGPGWITAGKGNWVAPWVAVAASADAPTHVDLDVAPGAWLSLEVRTRGEPAPRGVAVAVDDHDRRTAFGFVHHGAGSLGPLPPGTYRIRVSDGDSHDPVAEQTVTVEAGEQRALTLEVEQP